MFELAAVQLKMAALNARQHRDVVFVINQIHR